MFTKIIIYIIVTLFVNIITKETILFAWEMHRHGARAPYKGVVNGIDVFKENWTQVEELSNIGRRMLYLLGTKVKKGYVDEYKLISENYNPQEIYIRSTDVNRTIESIQSFLQGLYPEGTGPTISDKVLNIKNITYPPNIKYKDDFEKIIDFYNLTRDKAALPYRMSIEPVHLFYRPNHEFELYNTGICPGHKEIYEKQQIRPEVLELGDELNTVFPWLKTLEGTDNDKFLQDYWTIYKYMDGFICDDVDQRDFSYLKEHFGFNNETKESLRNYSKKYLWMDYSDTNYPVGHDNISIVANSYTIHSLINWMEIALDKSKKNEKYTKLVIYSAHDASIGALEAFMKYAFGTEIEYSTFAESRYIELYLEEDSNIPKVRYLKGDNTVKINKTFEEFKKIMNEKTWTDQQVNKFCGFKDNSKKGEAEEGEEQKKEQKIVKDNNNVSVACMIILIIVNVILLSIFILLLLKK